MRNRISTVPPTRQNLQPPGALPIRTRLTCTHTAYLEFAELLARLNTYTLLLLAGLIAYSGPEVDSVSVGEGAA